jgi:hypothetical protein
MRTFHFLLAPLALLVAFPAYASSNLYSTTTSVGIGITTPSDTLDINGGLGFTTTTSTVPTNGIYSPAANKLNFTTNGATALTITSTGSLGVGLTTPYALLEVSGGTLSDPPAGCCKYSAQFDTAGSYNVAGNLGIGMTKTGTARAAIQANQDADLLLEPNGGNVGIGTTTPGQELEVNGEVKIDTFAAASATTVCQNANVLSTCSSSIRYKEKVKPASFGLKEVMEMRPVTFKWKERDEKDFGLVAEDMEKVNPLFVTYERGQIEGVKYPQLTAVLVKAVQEQEAEIEELRGEIAALKGQPGQN